MKRGLSNVSLCGLVAAVICLAAGTSQVAAFEESRPNPAGLNDLRVIEKSISSIAENCLASTVSLRIGRAEGSGVVVNPDGLILTAAHVVSRPGQRAIIRFRDGTTATGTTLGIHPQSDAGMVQITDDGGWTFCEAAPPDANLKLGDWCLAIGHPGGYQADRGAPLRLGRIIEIAENVMRSDCTITIGDSGGPLFDLKGRVVGIHSRIAEDTSVNLHVPISAFHDHWGLLATGKVAAPPTKSRILTRLDVNKDGKVQRSELSSELHLKFFDELAKKHNLSPDKPYEIKELSKMLGFRNKPPTEFNRAVLRSYRFPRNSEQGVTTLAKSRYVRGASIRAAFRDAVSYVRRSTVQLKENGRQVALGFAVDPSGLILTKSSQVHEKVDCTLASGRTVRAQVLFRDADHDIAMLSIDARLNPIKWDQSAEADLGQWLVSPGTSTVPVAIGIVSSPQRLIKRTPGKLGVNIGNQDGPPLVIFVQPGSGADRAGIKQSDVIISINGGSIDSFNQLVDAVQSQRVGDIVKVQVKRNQKALEMSVVLSREEDFQNRGMSLTGPLSRRRDDFPGAIQHDTVLRPVDCGGPVVDLSGKIVGINAARAGRVSSYAIPASAIRPIVEEWVGKIKATKKVSVGSKTL